MNAKVSFLKRIPRNIEPHELDGDGFYLPRSLREEALRAKRWYTGPLRYQGETKLFATPEREYSVYINKKGEAY